MDFRIGGYQGEGSCVGIYFIRALHFKRSRYDGSGSLKSAMYNRVAVRFRSIV